MDPLTPLLGRTLVLVAHPDDEALGGGLLQRMREPHVVFATNGAPHDEYFWRSHGSREGYRILRAREARAALAEMGVRHFEFLASPDAPEGFDDQDLFRHIPEAARSLDRVLERVRPEALLTMSYEGGHPDHDTCNFLGALVRRRHGLPVWEVPLYCVDNGGRRKLQEFCRPTGDEVVLKLTDAEVERKRRAVRAYASQGEILTWFRPEREAARPMADYDYSQPPHPGKLNYERWNWSMTAKEVCLAFVTYLETLKSEETLKSR